ncbi:putative copper homeostasis (lipo)protein LpqS [Saccharomonospora azurea]
MRFRLAAHRHHLLVVAAAFAVLVPFVALHLILLCEPRSHTESDHGHNTVRAAVVAQHSAHFGHSANTDCHPGHPDQQHVLTETGHALPRSEGTLDGLAALGALAIAVSIVTQSGPCIPRGSPSVGHRTHRRTGRTLLLDLCIARS